MVASVKVRLGNTWVDSFGFGVTSPEWSTSYGEQGGGGCDEASFGLGAPYGYRNPDLRVGKLLRVYVGGWNEWTGVVDAVNTDTWEVHAIGLARLAARTAAIDGSGVPSSVVNTAVDAAIARGMLSTWKRSQSIGTGAESTATTTTSANYLNDLLDANALRAGGQWWQVWADGYVIRTAPPKTPTYNLVPKAVDLPLSYDEYATDVKLRYMNSTTHAAATVTATDANAAGLYRKEWVENAIQLGEISAATAQAHADAIIAQGKSKPGYTASVEASGWQLLNTSMAPVDPRTVRAGRMVRLWGVTGPFAQPTPYHDFTIGRTRYNSAEDTITLDPMGLVTNGSQEDVVAKVLGAAYDSTFVG